MLVQPAGRNGYASVQQQRDAAYGGAERSHFEASADDEEENKGARGDGT